MPTVRQMITRDFASGRLDDSSGLGEVRAIGQYILARLQGSLRLPGPVTLARFWNRTRTMNTQRVEQFLMRALQNRRANQCVSKRTRTSPDPTYHTQDVNHHAYEAVVTLLDRGRARTGGVAYGPIARRMPRRSVASKECACRSRCDGACRRNADGACVPRRGGGFLGSPPHPDQIVRADTAADRARVRNSARTRITSATLSDPDSMQDVQNGHRKSVRYSVGGSRMSRVASPKVRLPRT